MAGPPKDVPASELFLKLIEAPRPTEVIDFPRKGPDGKPVGRVRLQVLTQEEHDRARTAAHAAMKGQGFDKDDLQGAVLREVEGDTVARELLAMACLTDEGHEFEDGKITYGRIFRDASDLKKLRSDEIAVLFNAYLVVQSKYGPFESSVSTSQDVDAWVKRLVDGGSSFLLLHLPLPALADLTYSLAERVSILSGTHPSQSKDSLESSESSPETSVTGTS